MPMHFAVCAYPWPDDIPLIQQLAFSTPAQNPPQLSNAGLSLRCFHDRTSGRCPSCRSRRGSTRQPLPGPFDTVAYDEGITPGPGRDCSSMTAARGSKTMDGGRGGSVRRVYVGERLDLVEAVGASDGVRTRDVAESMHASIARSRVLGPVAGWRGRPENEAAGAPSTPAGGRYGARRVLSES